MSSIFISIASYCDPLLIHTIQDAIQKAEKPENLHFGVVEQQVHEKRLTLANETARQMVRYIGVAPEESRGVCWARSLANTLYEGEEFFLQIDAHMLFEQDWDTQFIRQLGICQRTNPKSLLTCYPNHFEWVDGIPTAKSVTQKVLAHVLKEPAALEADRHGQFLVPVAAWQRPDAYYARSAWAGRRTSPGPASSWPASCRPTAPA